ncbi:hypothetical protein [Cryobacterium sp. AP23]
MNKAELEMRARIAVGAARAGHSPEDDFLEMKREWPDPIKASRQLAGLANKANGERFLYLVGVDESDGSIHASDTNDPANWWAQVQRRFNETAPFLIRHLLVEFVPDEFFTVLLFESNSAPYVIMSPKGGSPELEIPIRDGTRTRSAKRSEVLAMSAQHQGSVNISVLSASMIASWHAHHTYATSSEELEEAPEHNRLTGTATLFLDHDGINAILLPLHLMAGTLSANGKSYSISPVPVFDASDPTANSDAPQFGTRANRDGIVLTGPGSCSITFSVQTEENVEHEWSHVSTWSLHAQFGVAGGSRLATLSVSMNRAGTYGDTAMSGYEYSSWLYRR